MFGPEPSALIGSFPGRLVEAAETAIAGIPAALHPPSRGFAVTIFGERVVIPYRIYNPEVWPKVETEPSSVEALISHCIYTRHHDGFVRQRHLAYLLQANTEWVVPFVLQLLGEYVLEIVQQLQTELLVPAGSPFTTFSAQNPEFVRRTKSRIVSYWNCYYRRRFPSFAVYPGFLVSQSLGWWNPHDVPRISKGCGSTTTFTSSR